MVRLPVRGHATLTLTTREPGSRVVSVRVADDAAIEPEVAAQFCLLLGQLPDQKAFIAAVLVLDGVAGLRTFAVARRFWQRNDWTGRGTTNQGHAEG